MSAASQQIIKLKRMAVVEQRLNTRLADVFYQMHWGENLMHREIAESIGISRPTVTRWFQELRVPSQPSERITKTYLTSWLYKTGQLKPKPRYQGPDRRLQETRGGVNVDFFKSWSPEMAYVLGYFAADGCLAKNRRGSRYLQFTSTDIGILRQIKRVMRANQAIRRKKQSGFNLKWHPCYLLQIGSLSMYRDLVKLGLIPNKARRLRLPAIPRRYVPDFTRGFFDGDGSVSYGLYPRSNRPSGSVKVLSTRFTSSSRKFLQHLKSALKKAGLEGGGIAAGTRASHLQYSVTDSLRLFHLMYSNLDHQPFLRRKYLKFVQAAKFKKGAVGESGRPQLPVTQLIAGSNPVGPVLHFSTAWR